MINITQNIFSNNITFLSFLLEADEETKPAPRNLKVIKVKPNKRPRKYDNVMKQDDNDNTQADDNNEEEMELVDDSDDNSDSPDTSDPSEDSSDDNNEDNSSNDEDNNSDDNQNKEGAGIDYDSMRKYNLFKNYISLYYGIDKYLDRIEGIIKDEPEANDIINTCIRRLHDLKQLTYDYVILKFSPAPYVQSMLFYQRIIASIEIIFNLIASLNTENETKKLKVKNNKRN